jgi:hypothetical protein
MARMPVLFRVLVVFALVGCSGCAARRVPSPPFVAQAQTTGDGTAQNNVLGWLSVASLNDWNCRALW